MSFSFVWILIRTRPLLAYSLREGQGRNYHVLMLGVYLDLDIILVEFKAYWWDLIPLNAEDFQDLSGKNANPASGQEIIANIIYRITGNFIFCSSGLTGRVKMGMAWFRFTILKIRFQTLVSSSLPLTLAEIFKVSAFKMSNGIIGIRFETVRYLTVTYGHNKNKTICNSFRQVLTEKNSWPRLLFFFENFRHFS